MVDLKGKYIMLCDICYLKMFKDFYLCYLYI